MIVNIQKRTRSPVVHPLLIGREHSNEDYNCYSQPPLNGIHVKDNAICIKEDEEEEEEEMLTSRGVLPL